MFKNLVGQKLTVFAFDSATNLPKSGDAANITGYYDLDDAGVTVLTDTSATEIDATNAKGYYLFDLAQAETNGNKILFSGKSSTSGIVVIGVPAVVYTFPTTGILAPGTTLTEGYAADGAAPTLEQMLYMMWSALAEFGVVGTTITCRKLDGVTTSMTFTTDSGANPTARTRTA